MNGEVIGARYNKPTFNKLMSALASMNDARAEELALKIQRYSYFEHKESEAPEDERMITVVWTLEELSSMVGCLLGLWDGESGADYFNERFKAFQDEHGDPDWYIRYLARPYNRERLDRLGAAAEEILVRKGRALITLSGFTPPAPPLLRFSDALAGRFIMFAEAGTELYLYDIQQFENIGKWTAKETVCDLASGETVRCSPERIIDCETLAVE